MPSVRLVFALTAVAMAACGNSVGPDGERRQAPFMLYFTARQEFATYTLECYLGGLITMDDKVEPGTTVTARGQIEFQRRAYRGAVTVQASGSWADQGLELEFTDSASVRLILSGVIEDTVFGSQRGPFSQGLAFGGEWDCTPDMPLLADSLLLAAGWTLTSVVPGYWGFDETHLFN